MKISQIIEAWCKSFYPSEEDIKIAERRASICENCEYKVELKSSILKTLSKNDKLLNKFKCGSCGCVLSKKLFSRFKESCPERKWDI